MKKDYKSMLHRFQTQESCHNSQIHKGWSEEFCKHLDELAGEDRSYVATCWETAQYEKAWTMSLNSQGHTTAPIQSRVDLPQALANIRKMNKEADEVGHQFAPIIRPDLKIRQRQGQQFQQLDEPPQVTPQKVQPISIHQARRNLLRALSIKVQAGLIGANLPVPCRHLPTHGGHPQDGKRGECIFCFYLKGIACIQQRFHCKRRRV